MGNCCDAKSSVEKQIIEFLNMLKSCPSLYNYASEPTKVLNFSRAWGNSCFGGSVLNSVGTLEEKQKKWFW
jgi:hypothetical protein